MNNNSNSNFRYARSDIILKIKIHRRKEEKAVEFKTKLGYNPVDLIMSREGVVIMIILKPFSDIKMIEQYLVLGKRPDMYLPDHILAVEIDEKGNIDRKKKEEERKIK